METANDIAEDQHCKWGYKDETLECKVARRELNTITRNLSSVSLHFKSHSHFFSSDFSPKFSNSRAEGLPIICRS